MDYEALKQAYRAVNTARDALNKMKDSDESKHDFHSAWYTFLVASSNVYAKLKPGCQTGPEKGWFERRINERKKDPLLQYLRQARNSEEHSTGSTCFIIPKHFGFVYPEGAIVMPSAGHEVRINGRRVVEGLDVKEVVDSIESTFPLDEKSPFQWIPVKMWLNPAVDTMHGNTFQPPKTHLGEQVTDPSPVGVAELGVKYLHEMVDEAFKCYGGGLKLTRL